VNRRAFVTGLGAVLAAPLGADAQQAGKVYRIAYVTFNPIDAAAVFHTAFRKALEDLGYIRGQNLIIEYRNLHGTRDRASAIAAELTALRPDVIVVIDTAMAAALAHVTKTTPTVVISGGDYLSTGLAASMATPGGTITGLSFLQSDLIAKRLELLKLAVPNLRRALLVATAQDRKFDQNARHEMEKAARQLGIRMTFVRTSTLADLEGVISGAGAEKVSAIVLLAEPLWWPHRDRIAEVAVQHGVPTIYELKEFVDAGFLMSYGPDNVYFFRRAATYVDKILRGANPANLPIEQPTKLELVINLKTAKALGLTIPASLLLRADQVIE